MDITLFGGVSVGDGSIRLNPRDRAVLAVLAMRPGEPVEADRLADALWGDTPPASWVKNLQGCVMRLRKALGSAAIQTSSQGYRLRVPADEIDAQRFERLVTRGREMLALEQPERAAYLLGEALALWQGRPFLELEEWDPGRIEAGRLDELRLEAEEAQIDATLQAGHHRDVLARAQSLADEAPLRERRWELLARAQYQAGHQTDALRTIHRVRRMLVEELGLDPSPSLEELEQAILRQDATLAVEESPVGVGTACPYQGLTPYDIDDAEAFFGRNEDVAACLNRLRDVGVLAVVGPSGSGKSSLIRAGVASALRRDGRRVVVIVPGTHPVDTLSSLPRTRAGVVLVVDQLEEVFSLCADPVERDRFLVAVAEHARTGSLVLSLRADHLGHLSAHPDFAKAVEPGLYLLSGMSEEQLRTAIAGPAQQAGLKVEPGLVDLLIREVKDEPGALPLLSHVLRETWLRREGRTLTVSGYQESGGVRQAVAQSAEAVFQLIGPDRQGALRDLLLRLVVQGPSGAPVRTPMPRRLVVGDGQQDELVDLLVGSRLVTSDGEVVEIAHEALAQAWPRLRAWLDDDIEGQRLLHHLAQAADAWDSLGRPSSELYRGTRLTRAIEWRESSSPELTPTERAFLAAGQRLAEQEERTAADRARVQSRMIRRLRGVLAGAALLLVAALVAGGFAVRQTSLADDSAAAAQSAQTAAEARQLGTVAATTGDISLSNLLAVRAVQMDDTPATRSDLMAVLGKHPQLKDTSSPLGESVARIALSPDGRRLAAYGADNDLFLLDSDSGKRVARIDLDGAGVKKTPWYATSPLAFSADGEMLAVGSQTYDQPAIRLLDPATLHELPVQVGHIPVGSKPVDVSFSRTGRFLAASFMHLRSGDDDPGYEHSDGSYTLVWDLTSPDSPPQRVNVPFVHLYEHMRLSPDGQTVYVGAPLTAYDVTSGQIAFKDAGITSWLPMDLNRQGTQVADLAADGSDVMLVDAGSGDVEHRLTGHSQGVSELVFSPSGHLVAASAGDRTVLVWDAKSGDLRYTIDDVEPSDGVAFSSDEKSLYTVAPGGMIRTWDLAGESGYLRPVPMPSDAGGGFAYPSPDASVVAYFGANTITFARVGGGSSGEIDTGLTEPYSYGSWSPDSHRFATGNARGVVSEFDRTGEQTQRAHVTAGFVSGVDFTKDGSWLAVSDDLGTLSILDTNTLRPITPAVHLPGSTCCLTMSPDGSTAFVLLSSTKPGAGESLTFPRWALVDVASGQVQHQGTLPLTGAPLWTDFSPDGRQISITSDHGELLLLDAGTGVPRGPAVVGHHGPVFWSTFSADGSRILTAAGDGTVGLWDARTYTLLDRVTMPGLNSGYAQFMSGSASVLIPRGTGDAFVWDTGIDRAVAFACRAAGRDLTSAEWHQYIGDQTFEPTCPQS